MRSPIAFLTVALVAALAACTRQADTAAEEKVIRDLSKKAAEAVAAKDTMAIGNAYAEDADFLAPNAPRTSGRAAIRAAWGQLFKLPNLTLTWEPTHLTVSSAGDLASETGAYKFGFDGPKGKRIEDVGKYVTTWKKDGGEWKMQYDIFNSDKAAM